MKKLLFSIMLALMCASSILAQNANRSGFFVEAAFGGVVGKTPQVKYGMDNYNLSAYTLSGAMISVAFGPRFRISNLVAYDIAIELQAPLDALKSQPVAKLMPVGFRFTSGEIYGNISIYGTIRLGGALGFTGESDYIYLTVPDAPKKDLNHNFRSVGTGGPAVSVGFGLNVTTHFYAGITCDMHYLFNQHRGAKQENLAWGLLGVRTGYRF